MNTFKLLGLTALTAASLGVATQAHAGDYSEKHKMHKDKHSSMHEMYKDKYTKSEYNTYNDIDGVTRYDLWTNEKLRSKLTPTQEEELSNYFEFEERQPCQNYMAPPQGFVRVDCELLMIKEPTKRKMVKETRQSRVLNAYDINFAFDSANLNQDAEMTVDRIASEIKRYRPREVVIAGHTDTAGPSSYNEQLSQERAMAVSQALTDMGIPNRVLDKKAFGERDLAVATADDVPLRENRRVEVRFIK